MTIHFLCPHGHHLTAPPERAGQPGSCPECGVKFWIPDRRRHSSSGSWHPVATTRIPATKEESNKETEREPSPVSRATWPGIVAGLLASNPHDDPVEIELEDGTTFAVLDMLMPRSTGDVAVLVVQGSAGQDVIAVPWSRIARCQLHSWQEVVV